MAEAPRFGAAGKLASELSDAELEAELRERRRRRAVAAAPRAGSTAERPGADQLARYFANLELPTTAGLDDVHAAYDRLVARYEPYATHADPERSRAARDLLESLERAYRALLAHLDPG